MSEPAKACLNSKPVFANAFLGWKVGSYNSKLYSGTRVTLSVVEAMDGCNVFIEEPERQLEQYWCKTYK